MLTTILIFFIIIVLLILSHEFGHFLFAKLRGIKVEEFGFGLPPRIFGIKKGETIYSFNLLPIGGFVKILGEEGESSSDPRSFANQPISHRALILSAGVLFNLIMAWLIFSAGFFLGTPTATDDLSVVNAKVTILQVQQNTPAETAGLKTGDKLLRLSSDEEVLEVVSVSGVQNFISKHKGQKIEILYQRDGKQFLTSAVPAIDPPPGVGALGIAMERIGIVKSPWYKALWQGLITTISMAIATVAGICRFIVQIFTGTADFNQIAGPVGIVKIVDDAAQFGFLYILQLTAVLSVAIGMINLIPFPGLDGGRLLFLGIEKIKGSPISAPVSNVVNTIGFILLILLMLIVTYHDIIKFKT